MKNIINSLIDNYKYILVIITAILVQSLTYFAAKITPFEAHNIATSIDYMIPLVPVFIYFYIFWYLMIFLIPLLFLIRDKKSFAKYITAGLICSFLSFFIFFFYPTIFNRDIVLIENFTTFIVSIIYKVDTPNLNCLPSMHCVLCFLFIFVTLDTKNMTRKEKIIIIFFSGMVILSTLLVKQHVIIDVITALIFTIIIYYIVTITKVYNKLFSFLKLRIK